MAAVEKVKTTLWAIQALPACSARLPSIETTLNTPLNGFSGSIVQQEKLTKIAGVAQVVEHLSNKRETLSSNPIPRKKKKREREKPTCQVQWRRNLVKS
jgi:hypothetical protein